MKINVKKPQIDFSQMKNFTVAFYVLIFALLVLLNVVSYVYAARLDVTEGRIFTLSQATYDTFDGLNENVTIKTFFVDEPPEHLINVPRETHEFLEEYTKASNGKVTYEILHPSSNDADKTEAQRIGLPDMPIGELTEERFELERGYFGIGIYYGDGTKFEIIPEITSTGSLEYDLTRRIKALNSDGKPKIGFLTGHDEYTIQDGFQFIFQELSEDYDVVSITTDAGDPIEADLLVIPTPRSEYSERDMFEIDQYIMGGGSVLWMVDGLDVSGLTATSLQNNVGELLDHYGVHIANEFVLDETSDTIDLSQYGIPAQYYPFLVKAISKNMDQDNRITRGMDSVTFLWVSPLSVTEEKEGRTITPLVRSTDKSWTVGAGANIDLSNDYGEPDGEQRVLVYQVEGKQESFFTDKKYPSVENDPRDNKKIVESVEDSKMIVVGDSEFVVNDEYDGHLFFLNVVEGLVGDTDLLELRNKSRSVTDRSLEEVDDGLRNTLKYGNILLVPVLIGIAGIARSVYRSRRKPLI